MVEMTEIKEVDRGVFLVYVGCHLVWSTRQEEQLTRSGPVFLLQMLDDCQISSTMRERSGSVLVSMCMDLPRTADACSSKVFVGVDAMVFI